MKLQSNITTNYSGDTAWSSAVNNHGSSHQIFWLILCGVFAVVLTAFLGIIMLSLRTSATDNSSVDDIVSVSIPASCTMGGNIASGDEHTAAISPGTYSGATGSDYENGIGKTTLTTFCNDYNGFSIYAVGNTNSTVGNTNLVGTSTGSTISTNVYSSGDTTSSWSMKVNRVENPQSGDPIAYNPANMSISTGYDSWHAIPSSYTKVAQYKASTGDSTTDDTLGGKVTTTYATYISHAQPADAYRGQVKYIMVHPYDMVMGTYTIAYHANGGTGSMTSSTNLNNFEDQTLPASTLTAPTDYPFAGWCTIQDPTKSGVVPTADPQTNCTGIFYEDEGIIPASTVASGGTLNLYAVWLGGKIYMQDVNSTILGKLLPDIGDTYSFVDKRDEQAYTVAKLADNKYWMTENLNLAGGTALSADDTDVSSGYISSFSTSNNLTKSGNTIVLPASDTEGFDTDNYSYVYNSGNKTNCGASGQDTPCYSYYSWDAATLGSGRSIETDNTDAPYSICPKGWRLPTSGAEYDDGWKRGDFYALATAYGADLESNYYEDPVTFYNNAGPGTTPNFLLSGFYGYGSFGDSGNYGYYWSATSYSSTNVARNLFFDSSSVNSAGGSYRMYGFAIRCTASF